MRTRSDNEGSASGLRRGNGSGSHVRGPVGFTREGVLLVRSWSHRHDPDYPPYRIGCDDDGQLICEERCPSWRYRRDCRHVRAAAEFLESRRADSLRAYSDAQRRFWQATVRDLHRIAYRRERQAISADAGEWGWGWGCGWEGDSRPDSADGADSA